ncbi:hypothetical protein [Phenylobacterium sp.]|jgi:tetratricopeptide (TPR) repeat protein|uniref:tetratricopeptide repeat protein n=1 Tax=Phenylobacterium sp. TaxID=1871053 RepID=UPI002E31378B|nr:hypothetical protein [Phenylobacterium sp.]HEX2561970.1 hypothetical protein [Phenylobacterium sp.]
MGLANWRNLLAVAAAACLLASASAAQAAWYRAETDRFVVFGEGRESRVREYAVKLTHFDRVLRQLNPAAADSPTGGKVEVYLVRGLVELRRVRPGIDASIAGFYTGNNEAMFAVADVDRAGLEAQQILFHEYAHHFMLANFPAAYPAWFVEGWAEYFMTAEINPKVIEVGRYNPGRAQWLLESRWIPLDVLLTRHLGQLSEKQRAMYYSQAWHLTHYMSSTPERAAQLNKAILAISKGEQPLAAFKAATGMGPKELEKALAKYRQLPILTLANNYPAPAVTVTVLPTSADDLLLVNLRLMASPAGGPDGGLLQQIRRKAADYPGDRLAQMTLARAEFTYGDVAAGDAIMQGLIAADPKDLDALVLAGVGKRIAGERDLSRKTEHYRAARQLFMQAYKLDQDDFRSLYHYARSRSVEPAYPNENDVTALLTARALAPTVQEISFFAGEALVRHGRKDEAASVLSPLLNWPHGGAAPVLAQAILDGKTYDQAVHALETEAKSAAEPTSASKEEAPAG